ncbi:patatin-like phospholipase family protein [Raoultibacter phocaeensis]|uniref:patatin-like phospholipase family protein n=1 Tax=Raoultibacter phocaeensis TaxID=2479841 RepID=UPI001119C632|nr:patatin family protein [Raoultibacter phocaeensis]
METSKQTPAERVHASLHEPAYTGCAASPVNLVLEGGAMRGQFTAGVLDFFMDQKFWAHHVIGTSAGALNGYNYVAGEDGRTCYLNTKYCSDWRYLSMKSFVRTGNAFGVEFTFDTIPNVLEPFNYEAFRNSPMKLTTVASNLETGEADYHAFTDPIADLPYLIASSAMPLVSKIVEIDGKHLLDGGTCDSVPIMYSLFTSTKKHVVVLTQHESYKKEPNKLQALASRQYSAYPYFVDRMRYRHFEYNRLYRALPKMHENDTVFVIRPPEPVTIGSMEKDPDKLFALYEQGYETAARTWPELKRYLGDDLR